MRRSQIRAIDLWHFRAKGLISKCKLKKYLFGNKIKEFCCLMTISYSVANQNAGFP